MILMDFVEMALRNWMKALFRNMNASVKIYRTKVPQQEKGSNSCGFCVMETFARLCIDGNLSTYSAKNVRDAVCVRLGRT